MDNIRIDCLLDDYFIGKILISSEFIGDGTQDPEYFARIYGDFEFGGIIEKVHLTKDGDGDVMIGFQTSRGNISFYDNDTIYTK